MELKRPTSRDGAVGEAPVPATEALTPVSDGPLAAPETQFVEQGSFFEQHGSNNSATTSAVTAPHSAKSGTAVRNVVVWSGASKSSPSRMHGHAAADVFAVEVGHAINWVTPAQMSGIGIQEKSEGDA